MDDVESLSHTKWECKYHVVFIPAILGNEHDVVTCTPTSCDLDSRSRPSRFLLSCAWRLTIQSFRDGLPQMSNFCCHPGRAGGPPLVG